MKKYIVLVEEAYPEGDEFIVSAKSEKEARKKAEKVMKKDEYFGMDIVDITEQRRAKE